MRDFARFTSADLAAVATLFGEIQELPPDRLVRAEHLARGLSHLIRAQVGIVSELHHYSTGNSHPIVPLLDFGWAGAAERDWNMRFFEGEQLDDPLTNQIAGIHEKIVTRARDELVPNSEWYRSPNVMELRRNARIDHCIYSNLFVSPGEGMSMAFHRAWGDRPFTARDVAIVDVVHSSQTIYVLPDRGLSSMTPRQREVLDGLLAGDSEKAIARNLELSHHTVHTYVKAIYEQLGVNSRPEMMSLWVGRRQSPVIPSADATEAG